MGLGGSKGAGWGVGFGCVCWSSEYVGVGVRFGCAGVGVQGPGCVVVGVQGHSPRLARGSPKEGLAASKLYIVSTHLPTLCY